MNQVQCRVDVLRCQSVGGLTPARAFWKSYNGICLYMTQFYLTSSHTAVLQWNYGWKSWLGFEEGLWGWGVAIVTGDGCPHESLTMNDPSLSLRHTHTHTHTHTAIRTASDIPFHIHTFKNKYTFKFYHLWFCMVLLLQWISLFYFDVVFYIYKLLFIYSSAQFLYQNNVKISTVVFPL